MPSFFLSLGFLLLLEARLLAYPGSYWPLVMTPFLIAAGCWFAFRRVNVAAIAFLFSTAVVLFLSLFPIGNFSAHIIAVFASILFFAFIYSAKKRKHDPIVLFSFVIFLALAFLFLTARFLLHFPLWTALSGMFFASFILFFFSHTAALELGFWLKFRLFCLSFVVGLLMAEFYWIFGQLPFHAVNIVFLLGIIYYTLWDIAHRYFSLQFTKRSLLMNVLILCAGVATVLLSAQWFPN